MLEELLDLRRGARDLRHKCVVGLLFTLLELCVSSLRRGHANSFCIVPMLTDDPRRESNVNGCIEVCCWFICSIALAVGLSCFRCSFSVWFYI